MKTEENSTNSPLASFKISNQKYFHTGNFGHCVLPDTSAEFDDKTHARIRFHLTIDPVNNISFSLLIPYSNPFTYEYMESYVLSHFADNPQITFNSLRFEKMELENRGQFHELVYYLNMVPFREQKKSYSSGLVIGRFQPLHKGHMYLFKKALEIAECLEIGIGSSQMSNQPKNPFTYEEREKLIKDAMFEENFTNSQYHIYPIPDLFNFKKWIESIFTIIGDFEVLFTNNLWIGRLIQQRGKILNYGLKHDFENYNGTYIRKLLQLRDDKWKSLVPSSSISFLEKWLRQNPN